MFKKLLVPVDLSDMTLANAALEKAKGLAQLGDSEIKVLYVMPVVPSTYLEYVPADFASTEKARVDKDMADIAAKLGTKVSTSVRSGGVYHEVLAEAEEWKADCIVVASHWPTLATYLIGSHATSIVRHANCSVLVVRG